MTAPPDVIKTAWLTMNFERYPFCGYPPNEKVVSPLFPTVPSRRPTTATGMTPERFALGPKNGKTNAIRFSERARGWGAPPYVTPPEPDYATCV